jgi:hypothetical protein
MAIPSLVLGSFNLTDWSGSRFATSVIAEGTSRGTPVPIEVAVKSWLQDGSIVVTQGYDNRTVTLRVKLRGTSLTAVANAEAALNAELGKPNTLTWTPASGPASVFVVVTSSMDPSPSTDEDIAEGLASPWRTYNLRLVCEAFVRSAAEVVATALGSGTQTVIPTPTSVTIDSGSSTTGWTAAYYQFAFDDATIMSSGSATPSTGTFIGATAIQVLTPTQDTTPAHIYARIEALRTGTAIDVSVTKQIVVTWAWDSGAYGSAGQSAAQNIRLLVNEGTTPVYLDLVSGTTSPGKTTWTEAIFAVPSSMSSISTMRFLLDMFSFRSVGTFSAQEAFYIDSVVRNNANTSVSTPRQLQRTIAVAGSARTQGSVTVEHATSALGDVLAYFWPDVGVNYSPALRQFRTSGGGVTADTTLVSGARENLVGATTVFTVPASRVAAGLHLLMARLGGANTTATVTWTATTVINSVDTGPTSTGTRVVPITTAYQIIPLDRVMLPTREVNALSATAQVKITLTATVSSGTTALLDEMWFFNSTIGQLIQVACGTAAPSSGGSSNRMFIKPATVTNPRPILRVGFASDESDSAFALATSAWEFPQFMPSITNVFTATTNALDAAVTLRHYPRWHSNAAS